MKLPVLAACAALAAGCASVPVAQTDLPGSPARPDSAEAATPPLEPYLMGVSDADGEKAAEPAAGDSAEASVYTCPMHLHVEEAAPGECPVCGMALVPRHDEER